MTACALVLHVGCRPKEAAYIVLHKTVVPNNYIVKHLKFKYKATVPKRVAKTKRDYTFLLPKRCQKYLGTLAKLTAHGYDNYLQLNGALAHYWSRTVLGKAGVAVNPETGNHYSLKTARALRAT